MICTQGLAVRTWRHVTEEIQVGFRATGSGQPCPCPHLQRKRNVARTPKKRRGSVPIIVDRIHGFEFLNHLAVLCCDALAVFLRTLWPGGWKGERRHFVGV